MLKEAELSKTMSTNERQAKEITQLKQSVITLEEHHQIIRKHMEKEENELLKRLR